MTDEQHEKLRLLENRVTRERAARKQSEKLLEDKSRELYIAHTELQQWSETLEEKVTQRTEELERQTRELQTLIQDRERFTANVTHELRTPLQGILGFAKIGIKKTDQSNPEKIIKWFNTIYASGDTLLQLVNNLLDIAKFDANLMEINLQEFTVDDLYEDVNNEFQIRCKDKNVRLVLQGDGGTVLNADQFRMGQIFRNLIGNALKFCDDSSAIVIDVSDVSRAIELRIINKGPRIPKTESEAIFSAFVESSLSQSSSGGTGLGLAICRQIIEAHKGRIWLDESHSDTCFVVSLPKRLKNSQEVLDNVVGL